MILFLPISESIIGPSILPLNLIVIAIYCYCYVHKPSPVTLPPADENAASSVQFKSRFLNAFIEYLLLVVLSAFAALLGMRDFDTKFWGLDHWKGFLLIWLYWFVLMKVVETCMTEGKRAREQDVGVRRG